MSDWTAPTPKTTTLRDGRTLAWYDIGDPDGVPVVFFHGCPDTRHAAFPGDAPAARHGVRLWRSTGPATTARMRRRRIT